MVVERTPAPRRPLWMVAVAGIVLLSGLSGVPVSVSAEVTSEVSIDIYNSLIFEDALPSGEDISAGGTATAQLDLRNSGSRDVRSWFQLRSTLAHRADGTPATIVDVPRAEVRWRMTAGENYTMRYTAGRTRLTWGDGVLYNAGDVLNGAAPDQTNLIADTLRDETVWLLSAYLPLGRFSFVEPVVLLPMYALPGTDAPTGTAEPSAQTAYLPRPASETGAGARVQGQIAGVKSETGYLYHGSSDNHRPYVSLQGNLLLDWYTGVSWSSATEQATVSGGLLYNGVTDRRGSWSVRTEALWETSDDVVQLFPEITWSPSQLFSLFLRGLTSSEMREVNGAAGFSWTPSTGLSLSLYGVGDTNREVGAITTAVSYVF